MNTIENKTCFIGHRVINLTVYDKLKKLLEEQILLGTKTFMIGTHGEFDSLCLETCKNLRNDYPDIKIEVVITSLNQIKKKLVNGIYYNQYENVKITMFEIEETFYKNKIICSNQQMVDNCDTLICYVDTTRKVSGAKKIYKYAVRKGKKIINLFDEQDEPTFNMTREEKIKYWKNLFEKLHLWNWKKWIVNSFLFCI